MASIDELLRRYSKDERFRAQVDGDIKAVMSRADADMGALMALGKKYGLKISLADAPRYIALAKRNGIIK